MHVRSLLIPALICLAASLQAQDQQARDTAKALVKEAVAFAKKHGKEALARETNQGQGRFHVKPGESLYVAIYDMQGVCQANGFQSDVVGANRWSMKDPDGVYIIQVVIHIAKTRGSGWTNYKYFNPKTDQIEEKTTYVEYFDGWVLACGVYR